MRVFEIRVLLLLLSSVQCLCDCPLPPSGTSASCSDTKPPYANILNTKGAPPSNGSCEFDSSFCNYTQECRDPVANDWTLPGSYAEVQGRNGEAAQYSVLQSPLLRIDHVTCFQFSASVRSPSRLSVYLGEKLESSCTVMSEVYPGDTVIYNETINIRPATGKIFFRGKSGGGSIGYVRLYHVSLITGRCEDPQCSFENEYNGRACHHWEWNGWNVTSATHQSTGVPGNVAALGPGLLAGTLKTDLLVATGTQTACLQFFYRMTGMNDTLSVSVQHEDGRTELMWQVTNHNESSSWSYATVPLLSDNAFFIIFQGQRCRTQKSTDTAIDNVKVLRPSSCDHQPQGSKPYSQQLTRASDPSCDLPPTTTTSATTTSATSHLATTTTPAKVTERETSTTINVTSDLSRTTTSAQVTERETPTTSNAASDPPTSTSDDSSQTDFAEKDSNIPAIVGASAGVVVLAVIGIVLAVVIWRIRKRKRRGLTKDKLNPTNGSKDGAISMSGSTVLLNGGDYAYATAVAVDSRTNATDIDPYEIAEDGAPGKSRFSPTEEYNVLNVHGSGQKLPKPHGYSEDHYSHINDSQPSVLYSQVHKTRKRDVTKQRPSGHQDSSGLDCKPHIGQDPGVVYSQVQKKGKSGAAKQPGAAGSDPGAENSQVQKKGNKPAVAVKPTIAKKPVVSDDYNRIDFLDGKTDRPSGDEDMYNRLEEV